MKNKKILIIIGLILGAILAFFLLRFLTGEDNWLCQNGEWVKHGNPSQEKPAASCK